MSFGTKLKLCRSALGLSQQQLADLVGSTKQIVSLYEKDERIPKVTTAAKYADAVKVPLKYLITDSIPMPFLIFYVFPRFIKFSTQALCHKAFPTWSLSVRFLFLPRFSVLF